eukprot:XP_011665383.1 PREDICTED: uncharacterized protein LOC587954 isoform X1 [Strongylocentrotus purpuratus]
MATEIESENRIKSILSTLEILDGKNKIKKKILGKRQSESLRNPTYSSALKTHHSLSCDKETRMVPKILARENDETMVGKYSTFLAQIVTDSSSKERRNWKKERNSDSIFDQDNLRGDRPNNFQRRRDTFKFTENQHGTSGDTRRPRDAKFVQNGKHLIPSLDRKHCKPFPIRTENDSDSKQNPEQTEQMDFIAENTTSSKTSTWQQVVKSRLILKLVSDATTPRVAEVVETKMKARRIRKSSSELDKDKENGGFHNHLSTVIGATVAFKRKKLKILREERKFRLSRLFRVVARLVVVIRRICEVHFVERGRTEEVDISFAKLVSTRQRTDLMFDVTDYKAKKKWQLMSETKRILQKSTRSEHDIQHIETTLREMSALGEYPASMQRSIARVGWYESYGPNRVIVREGHMPDAFYFILSGSALVSVPTPGEVKPKILAILLRGDSFGELAILNQSKRTSTVTTRENVEMFVISAEDFTNIVMSGNSKMLQDPGTATFMRSVEFLKEWPLNKIENNPKKCVFNFFRKDTVLVRDSKLSEWIYVVKSGSCSVLKQLKNVEPELYPKKRESSKDERATSSRHKQLLLDRERSFTNRRMIAARAQRESLYNRGMDLPYLMMNEELTEGLAPNRNRSTTILAGEDGTDNIEEQKREEKWMEELEEGGALNDMKESLLYPLIEVERKDEDDVITEIWTQRTFAHDLNQRALRR